MANNDKRKLWAVACYLFAWVSGLVIFLIEKKDKLIRFHAAQSIVVFLGLTIINMILMAIPFFGWMLIPVLRLLGIILWIVLMIKAYQLEKYELPLIQDLVKKLL